ncbi:TRIC cation channel family protein [Actinopolymorpha rutila]|uniref:Putative membrane protein YeiH n=1 Tax=Actinopolymorpha rutila TaxID=446787 RepID=A0A852ZH34_9ACTN|nr:putative membrane protein YeiH [Actinopolymorpha rutila]
MTTENPLLLALDLAGTFAFALNGALTAVRVARLDIVGVVTLGMITALGGGILRDILIDYLPPATFSDWRYLAVAAAGSLIAFGFGHRLHRMSGPIVVFDAAGLSLFAVTGASKALDMGLGPAQAVILGAITGVGGGTLRDVLLQRIPTVLRSELYAIPALVAATITVLTIRFGVYGVPAALCAAIACFAIRMVGVRFGLNAPRPPGQPKDEPER